MNMLPQSSHALSPAIFLNRQVLVYLQAIAYALFASSVLYLIAANWWMLPTWLMLLLPQAIFLLTACLSAYVSSDFKRQSLETVTGFMLGLSLAVIGQRYQTGADSYLLFVLWSGLLLPWLWRKSTGIFILFSLLSQLALYFYFAQTYLLLEQQALYLLLMNLLAALCWLWSMHSYRAVTYVFIAAILLMSVCCMLLYRLVLSEPSGAYLISAFALPTMMLLYFYRKKLILESSLMAVGLALNGSLWLLTAFDLLWRDAIGRFLIAVLVFLWFAAISYVLKRIFPDSKFAVMPLALGAWVSGVLLASIFLIFWQSVSLLFGAAFVLLAWRLLQHQQSLYLRQLGYCLWICGQVAILSHIYLLTEKFWLVFFIQLLLLGLTLIARLHWFKVMLQILTAYLLALVAFVIDAPFGQPILLGLNYALIIAFFLSSPYWQYSAYVKSVVLALMVLLLISCFDQEFALGLSAIHSESVLLSKIILYVLPTIAMCIFILKGKMLSKVVLLGVAVLGLILIAVGYFEIFILMVLLAWASSNSSKLFQALAVCLLVFWLWLLYYNLALSFLMKSSTIFASALLVFALSKLLHPYALPEGRP